LYCVVTHHVSQPATWRKHGLRYSQNWAMKLEQEHKQLATLWNRRMKKQCDANPMHLHWHAKVPEQPEHDSCSLPGSPCSKNSPATATTGVLSSQEVSRIRQPHQVLFPSIDFHNFPLQYLARTRPHYRVCPSVHTTHTQVRNQVIMLWAMPSSMHLQAYSASQWVRVQMQSVTSHVFKEIPSASFSILQPNFTRKCPRWLFGSLARWSQLQWLPEFCAPKTAGAWVKQKLKDKTVPLKCNDAIQPIMTIMYLFA